MQGKVGKELRNNYDYKAICLSGTSPLYNYSSLLSATQFKDILVGAILIYDQFNNELIISNNRSDIAYSYVFNIDTKQYHKIAKTYKEAHNSARYVIENNGDVSNIVDLHFEENALQPILLQSRPFSLEAFYTHIQRMILLTDSEMAGLMHMVLSVYGSDNLNTWKCLISAQKRTAAIRQIRTNRAPKSNKDYIVVLSGYVNTDTDISDFISDYTVVSRKLG